LEVKHLGFPTLFISSRRESPRSRFIDEEPSSTLLTRVARTVNDERLERFEQINMKNDMADIVVCGDLEGEIEKSGS